MAAAAGGGFELGTEGKLEGVKDPQANGTEERRGLLKQTKKREREVAHAFFWI